MTATNHVLTGILIVSVVHNPVIALPLALLSHFALDALPHYGDRLNRLNSFKFKLVLGSDIYLALMVLVLMLILHPPHMWLLIFGGILGASPDLMWIPDFISALRGLPAPVYGRIRRFHSKIQWYQEPKGAWVEAAWFVAVFITAFGFTIAG